MLIYFLLKEQTREEDDFYGKSLIEDPKIVVYLPLLLDLFKVCKEPSFGSYIDPANRTVTYSGAMITIKGICNNNHQFSWSSSPTIGSGKSKVGAVNILIGTYAYTNGENVKKVLNSNNKLDK